MDQFQSKDKPLVDREILDVLETHGHLQAEIVELMKTVDGASSEDVRLVNLRLEEALNGLRQDSLEKLSLLPASSLQVRISEFSRRCGFDISENGSLSLAVVGCSYIEILEEAQRLSWELTGGNSICPEALDAWQKDPRFLEVPEAEHSVLYFNPLAIDTGDKDRFEQEEMLAQRDMGMLTLPELAVVHAVSFVINGEDIFRGYILRTQDSALALSVDGLDEFDPGDWTRDEDIIASSKNL
jgi:hypothetical protein